MIDRMDAIKLVTTSWGEGGTPEVRALGFVLTSGGGRGSV